MTAAAERARPALSRDGIAEAALQITLDQPQAPLTLARLGAELGADPTAIYRHFRNRDELLLELADRIYGASLDELEPLGPDDDWERALTDVALGLRATMLRRPSLSAEVGSRFTGGPNERVGVARLIDVFRRGGFAEDDAKLHARTFGALVLATIVASATALTHTPEAHELDMRAAHDLYGPTDATSAAEYEEVVFAVMLRTHLAGVRALLASEHDSNQPGGTP